RQCSRTFERNTLNGLIITSTFYCQLIQVLLFKKKTIYVYVSSFSLSLSLTKKKKKNNNNNNKQIDDKRLQENCIAWDTLKLEITQSYRSLDSIINYMKTLLIFPNDTLVATYEKTIQERKASEQGHRQAGNDAKALPMERKQLLHKKRTERRRQKIERQLAQGNPLDASMITMPTATVNHKALAPKNKPQRSWNKLQGNKYVFNLGDFQQLIQAVSQQRKMQLQHGNGGKRQWFSKSARASLLKNGMIQLAKCSKPYVLPKRDEKSYVEWITNGSTTFLIFRSSTLSWISLNSPPDIYAFWWLSTSWND
ncbi:hypothetical protein RFI_17544, partial [Reticulomyxa filosa]